jgi:hypothetical protein
VKWWRRKVGAVEKATDEWTPERSFEEAKVESLAERLHDATADWSILHFNLALPRWFALRDDLKETYREAARSIIASRDGGVG